MCHQSVGLIARALEASGIPTLSMSSAFDITESVWPPRAAFLDFPLGHTTGKPNAPKLQQEILLAALDAFRSLDAPGVKPLPFAWSSDESWKETVFAGGDERQPRHATPQYQTAEDRERAEGCGPEACAPPI